MNLYLAVGFAVVCYLLGSIPFGYCLAILRGVDLRRQGSGNIGATNVGRALGRRWGILAFALDFAKGAGPTALGLVLAPADFPANSLAVAAGLSAFLGHLFPIFLGFRGGKGVATGAGVVAVLLPGPALVAFLVWLTVVCATRIMSLASLAAIAALAAWYFLETSEPFGPRHAILSLFCLIAPCLVLVRHTSNLYRLAHGTENRLSEVPAMSAISRTIHVMSLGLWFGSVVFFLLATLVIFHTFEAPSKQTSGSLPDWVDLLKNYDKPTGTRLAGTAVGPLFAYYFALQGVCGFLALIPALVWSRAPGRRIDQIRFFLLVLALATVLVGFPLSNYVSELRTARYSADNAVAERAKEAFGVWHTASLFLNFGTLLLVTGGMGLAAHLPAGGEKRTPLATRSKLQPDPQAPVETGVPSG